MTDTSHRGYAAVALWNPKTPANVGGVLRAAGCYGADLVVVAGKRRMKTLSHLSTDVNNTWKQIPVIQPEDPFDVMPIGSIPIAVDLLNGAIPLPEFLHPDRAFYVFGPEDGTLRDTIVGRCKYKVMVPTAFCMNLAATVNVILYDRLAKQHVKSSIRLIA
jgi:tRNA(Leu) C34 or U34 (ribose-2'-O)-methylase TrmL